MKKIIAPLFGSLFVLAFLSACNVVSPGSQETANERFKREQNQQLQIQKAQTSQKQDSTSACGVEGKISVSGVIVDQSNNPQLDNRIKASTSNVALSHKVISSTAKNLTKVLTTDKSYIALGCKKINPTLIAGLNKNELKEMTKTTALISANTVIICGEASLNYAWLTVAAHKLIFIDAVISTNGSNGMLSINADHLTLIGKNSVTTSANLEFITLQTIDGEGSLVLAAGAQNVCSVR